MKSILFALALSAVVLHAYADTTDVENPGTCNCGANDRCCIDAVLGAVCYNPTTHTCADNRKLCGINEGVCQNTCYNRRTHRCINSVQGCALCGVTDAACNGQCYSPNQYRCTTNGLVPLSRTCPSGAVCPQGKLCCGLAFGGTPICFDPLTESCCQSQLNDRTSCPLLNGNRQACCQQRLAIQCFNPQTDFCCATTTPFSSVCSFSTSGCCPAVNSTSYCY